MKCTPSAMKFGTESRLSSLILNMIFENSDLDPKLKTKGGFGLKIAMCSNFYEIWLLVLIEHASYEYNTRHCLGRSRDYLLVMIIGCKIRLTVRT